VLPDAQKHKPTTANPANPLTATPATPVTAPVPAPGSVPAPTQTPAAGTETRSQDDKPADATSKP